MSARKGTFISNMNSFELLCLQQLMKIIFDLMKNVGLFHLKKFIVHGELAEIFVDE